MDLLYPSSNYLGIPDLDPTIQPDSVPLPVRTWGSTARVRKHSGTWSLYADDRRFTRLLKEPATLVETGALAAIEPNISVYDDTPKAMAFATLYRKRWVARYWQLAGVNVFVDCNLPARILESPEARCGIPAGWRAFATRGYDRRIDSLAAEHQFACSFHDQPIFLVIGGGKDVAEWCSDTVGAIHSGYQSTKQPYSCNGSNVPALECAIQ